MFTSMTARVSTDTYCLAGMRLRCRSMAVLSWGPSVGSALAARARKGGARHPPWGTPCIWGLAPICCDLEQY